MNDVKLRQYLPFCISISNFSACEISSAGDFFLSSSKFICGVVVNEKRIINIVAFYKITSLIMV